MTKVKTTLIQLLLTLFILLLLTLISVPAWQAMQARQALDSGQESGATLAERYLLLGDWPAGHGKPSQVQISDFSVQEDSVAAESMVETTTQQPGANHNAVVEMSALESK